ncbi:MAG: hypothetical protein HGB01_04545 [Chlorobiaceae bacterium]|nr:hypothetical protein [Chlorobiaceae bacterium]
MQENHDFGKPDVEPGNLVNPAPPKKRRNRKQIIIGVTIALALNLLPAFLLNYRFFTDGPWIGLWLMCPPVTIALGIYFLRKEANRDIGTGLLSGCAVPLLLLALLFGACMVGIGGASLFNLFK